MKGLSLWQPWASLMDFAAKKNETRGWSTSYRGELLICATKRCDKSCIEFAELCDSQEALARTSTYPEPVSYDYVIAGDRVLPLGVALCVVDLVDCIPITDAYADTLSEREYTFGNYEIGQGRFAWVTTNLRRLNEPIQVKGAQGLWQVSPGVERWVRQGMVATCRHCGCTHEFACPNGCGWAAVGVCTNCVGAGA